jgi:hypothetical protein
MIEAGLLDKSPPSIMHPSVSTAIQESRLDDRSKEA